MTKKHSKTNHRKKSGSGRSRNSHGQKSFGKSGARKTQEAMPLPYTMADRSNGSKYIGKVDRTKSRNAFIIRGNDLPDVFVYSENLHGAMDQDIVQIDLLPSAYWGTHPEGIVERILERGKTEISGTFKKDNGHGYVIPVKKNEELLFIRKDAFHGAKTGDRVTAKIVRYPDERNLSPEGEITEILSHADSGEADIRALIRAYGLSEKFPEEVEAEANRLASGEITPSELEGRTDLRDEVIFTIDGADSKDLDDAVSLTIEEDGNYLLGVHIADVSHYVTPGTALDREALHRGNSTYLLTRVVPMLPKSLSNGICSLFEGADRLTLSCFMKLDPNGNLLEHRIEPTVICSKARLVYDDVSDMLEQEDSALIEKYSDYYGANIYRSLKEMEQLARILNTKRSREGSLDFDLPEAHITLDSNDFAIDVQKEERRIANRLIEEFMLAANRTVAAHYHAMHLPFIYRVHDEPDMDKTETLKAFLKSQGLATTPIEHLTPRYLQQVLEKTRGEKEAEIVNYAVLHSMMKASYSTEGIGHFSLAFPDYCHFTSPIRRYPDLMIHRLIHQYFDGIPNTSQQNKLLRMAEKAAEISSATERHSQDLEREVEKMKKAEYMSRHVGETYDAIISGVSEFGIFVALPNTIEGMIRLDSLEDDFYMLQPEKYRLIGKRTGKTYAITDPIRVTVLSANPEDRQIDFTLATE